MTKIKKGVRSWDVKTRQYDALNMWIPILNSYSVCIYCILKIEIRIKGKITL